MFFPFLKSFLLAGYLGFWYRGAFLSIHFIYCLACSSPEFIILLIWPWVYSDFSIWYVLVRSILTSQSFCTLAFVGFLLLSKDAFFLKLSCFSYHGLLWKCPFGSWLGWKALCWCCCCFPVNREKFFISFISIFTNPSARAGYDTRLVFKRSLTGLNSEFSFS